MISVRRARNSDWKDVAVLADEAVAHVANAPKQSEWFRKRVAFAGERRHYVAEEDRRVVGYAAIERDLLARTDNERIFIVLRWTRPDSTAIADALLMRLRQDFATLGLRRVWLREYADDTPFVAYLLTRGFERRTEYTHEGRRLIELGKNVDEASKGEESAPERKVGRR